MTTFLAKEEVRVGERLRLPEHHAICAVLFLGHPVRQPTKLSRNPVSAFATVDTFDGEPIR